MLHPMASLGGPSLVLSCPKCRTFVQLSPGLQDTVCWQCLAYLLVRQRGRQLVLEVGTPSTEPPPDEKVAASEPITPWFPPEQPPETRWSRALPSVIITVVCSLVFWFLSGLGGGGVVRSADGCIEVKLPAGWKQAHGPASAGPIFATGPFGNEWLNVRSSHKREFKDLRSFDAASKRELLAWLSKVESTPTEAILLNGHPALRCQITGKTPERTPVRFVVTAVETENRFSEVFAWGVHPRPGEVFSKVPRLANGLCETRAAR